MTIESTVDASTYSRDLADLPVGDLFAANADRDVTAALGFPDTEAVMQQGQFIDEDQRALNHDDVATLRLGMAGLDETAGTADDYTLTLTYAGMTTACDIVLDFDNSQTSVATLQRDHHAAERRPLGRDRRQPLLQLDRRVVLQSRCRPRRPRRPR